MFCCETYFQHQSVDAGDTLFDSSYFALHFRHLTPAVIYSYICIKVEWRCFCRFAPRSTRPETHLVRKSVFFNLKEKRQAAHPKLSYTFPNRMYRLE